MAKYGRKTREKVGGVMHERKHGTLKSGSGRKVKNRKQAIAIGLSEARREGDKVPPRRRKKGSARQAGGSRSRSRRSRSSSRSRTRSRRRKRSAK